jgi:hypothetical protein
LQIVILVSFTSSAMNAHSRSMLKNEWNTAYESSIWYW